MSKLPPMNIWLMQKSKEGYKEAREELMRVVLTEIEGAKFQDEHIQKFLIDAFKEIIGRKSADKALLLKGEKGGQKTKSFNSSGKDWTIAEAVVDKRLKPGKKKTLEICYQEVADEFRVSPALAKKRYMALKSSINEYRKMWAEYEEERANQQS